MKWTPTPVSASAAASDGMVPEVVTWRVPVPGRAKPIPILMGWLLSQPAYAEHPLNYLETFGPKSRETTELIWGLMTPSIVIVAIVSLLVIVGVALRFRRRGSDGSLGSVERRDRGGLWWIYIGVGLSTLVLAGFVYWTIRVMAAIDRPPEEPGITIEVAGELWWWDIRYVGDSPATTFHTANEIHIPVGEPVRFKLSSDNVIHSFWVPALGGKTDLIPGRANETWLQADEPGVYWGQCAEYCGRQHAHMALRVFAEPREAYEAWRAAQLEPADPVDSAALREGRRLFVQGCGECHTVRGTPANGAKGPDLTHLMSRSTIAAGLLENNIGNLSGWVANPQSLKPGAHMPIVEMSGAELDSIRNYLLTLD